MVQGIREFRFGCARKSLIVVNRIILFAHQIKYGCRRQTLKLNGIKLSETTLFVSVYIFKVRSMRHWLLLLSLNERNKNHSKVAEIEEESVGHTSIRLDPFRTFSDTQNLRSDVGVFVFVLLTMGFTIERTNSEHKNYNLCHFLLIFHTMTTRL